MNLVAVIVCMTSGIICAFCGNIPLTIMNFGLAILNVILWRK